MKNSKSNLLHRSVQLLGCAAALVMAGLPHAEAVAGPAADSSSESQMRDAWSIWGERLNQLARSRSATTSRSSGSSVDDQSSVRMGVNILGAK